MPKYRELLTYGFLFILPLWVSTPEKQIYASEVSIRDASDSLTALFNDFLAEFLSLNAPEFGYSYVENFKNIQSLDGIKTQNTFFSRYRERLQQIDRSALSPDLRYNYDALLHEVEFNLERLSLEKNYRENGSVEVPANGLFSLPNHDRWYALYVKRWTSLSLSPDEIFNFGMKEVARTTSEFRKIQSDLGYADKAEDFYTHLNSDSFQVTDETELVNLLHSARETAQRNLGRIFEVTGIPTIGIQPIPNVSPDSPPGYYDPSVAIFFYNFYANRFPKRALEWLYIHEAVPGHHYQYSVGEIHQAPISKLFWYPGYSEGWGAYVETLGDSLGFYQDPYQQLGKWEWDMVRSIRLALDVGIHSQGWTKGQALEFWQRHIPNQDSIALREIDRIIRWPVQVMSYKLGEHTILNLKSHCLKRLGVGFDLKQFHANVLKRGSIPLPVLSEAILDACGP